MNLYDFFEECSLEKQKITPEWIYQANDYISDYDLVKVANKWLIGISNKHQVPGKVVLTVAGICDFYKEHNNLTTKQKTFLIGNLIQYWDQIGLLMRSQIL